MIPFPYQTGQLGRRIASPSGGVIAPVHFWALNDGSSPYANTGTAGTPSLENIGTVTQDGAFPGISLAGAGAVAAPDTSNVFDSIIAGADKSFSAKITARFDNFTADAYIIAKHSTTDNQRQLIFIVRAGGNNLDLIWYGNGTSTAPVRGVRKASLALSTATEYTFAFSYDGAIDTNNGLDRVKFYLDGVQQTGLTLFVTSGTLPDIGGTDAYLAAGAFVGGTGAIRGGQMVGDLKNFALYDVLIDAANSGA